MTWALFLMHLLLMAITFLVVIGLGTLGIYLRDRFHRLHASDHLQSIFNHRATRKSRHER